MKKNVSFKNSHLPVYANCITMQSENLPVDWTTKAGCVRAAKGQENIGLLVGYIDFEINHVSLTDVAMLQTFVPPEELEVVNVHGEVNSVPAKWCKAEEKQIFISNMYDLPSECNFPSGREKKVFDALYALQCPDSSPWQKPFLRLLSRYEYSKGRFVVRFYVYFSRFLFEMISDEAVRTVMENINGLNVRVRKTTQRPMQPPMFTTSYEAEAEGNTAFQFSLAGLMRRAESPGYAPISLQQQPANLAVDLFEFQRSTLNWMLDQEHNKLGLNGYFWEEWVFNASSSVPTVATEADASSSSTSSSSSSDQILKLYYFPLAGELRMQMPPVTNGGLLCEEMGLGMCLCGLFT